MKKIEISVQSENVRPAGPLTEYRLRPDKVIQGRGQIPLITPDLFAEVKADKDCLIVTIESGDGILGKTLAAAIPVVDSSQTIFEYKPHGNAMTTAKGLAACLPETDIPFPFNEIYPDKQYTARAYRPLTITAHNKAEGFPDNAAYLIASGRMETLLQLLIEKFAKRFRWSNMKTAYQLFGGVSLLPSLIDWNQPTDIIFRSPNDQIDPKLKVVACMKTAFPFVGSYSADIDIPKNQVGVIFLAGQNFIDAYFKQVKLMLLCAVYKNGPNLALARGLIEHKNAHEVSFSMRKGVIFPNAIHDGQITNAGGSFTVSRTPDAYYFIMERSVVEEIIRPDHH